MIDKLRRRVVLGWGLTLLMIWLGLFLDWGFATRLFWLGLCIMLLVVQEALEAVQKDLDAQ